MIIKIEDFPNGKVVKHITIDISFDEDGTHTTKVKQDYVPEVKPTVYSPPYVAPNYSHPAIVDPHTAVGTTTAIPKEMTDSEF